MRLLIARSLAALALVVACAKDDAGSAPPPPPPPTAAPTLPVACRNYQRLVEALSRCDGMPPPQRAALKQAITQMLAGWATLEPADAVKVAEGCQAGAEALARTDICPELAKVPLEPVP